MSKELKMTLIKAHGIDMSKWVVDWDMPADPPHPIDFIIQRVSWGLHTDERFENHSKKINQCSRRGAYHFYSSAVPWMKQAELFLRNITENPFTTYHMAWLDYETKYNKLTRRTSEEARMIIEFLSTRFDGKVGLYANPNTTILYLDRFGTWMLDWPLWIAQYWFLPSPDKEPSFRIGRSKMKRAPTNWQFWQYTEKGNAAKYGVKVKKSVDLDVANFTVPELDVWLDIGTLPPPPPTPQPGWNEAIETMTEKVVELGQGLKR